MHLHYGDPAANAQFFTDATEYGLCSLMLSLGIDSGTQSTKTIVLDSETGEILASAQQAYGLIGGLPPGHLEQDPSVWVDAVDKTVRACLEQLGARKDEVAAIGVSGQQHGCVVLDDDDQPVRPAKLWCDTSTVEQCEQFAAEFGGAKGLIDLAGNPILPGYTAPKLLWLKENEPANFRRTKTVLLPHDYLNFWLTGEKKMEYGDASGTGWMNVRTRTWCEPILNFIDPSLNDKIPRPGSSRAPNGLLRDELRKAWGLKQSPVVSAGGGDNMMGAIGTGNITPGCVTASLGTSGTLYSYSATPVIDPQGEIAAFCDSTDAWLPLVCTMNVTVATEQARALFNWDHATMEEQIRRIPAGAEGLLFLPYLNGERTPNLPNGSGVFHGLSARTMTPAHMARAVMEGATMGLAYGLNRFRELGVEPTEIRLTGGGSKSAIWRQICADVFGVSTVCLASAEGAALGAAIQAAATARSAAGELGTLRELSSRIAAPDESTRAQPSGEAVALYAELLKRQTGLTRKLHAAGYL
jgi:xylulokinase